MFAESQLQQIQVYLQLKLIGGIKNV